MKPEVYRNYNEFSALVVNTLLDMVRRTKGSVVTFNPKKVAVLAGIDTHPVVLTLVKDVIERLREKGLVTVFGRSKHGIKYAVHKESPLWSLAKEGFSVSPSNPFDFDNLLLKVRVRGRFKSQATY
ncbi:MAG: hypothetical protein QW230_00995 [Thermofilum sp.]